MLEAEIIEDGIITLDAIKYPVQKDGLIKLVEVYKNVEEIDLNADDEKIGQAYQFVVVGHKKFIKARNAIEKTRKQLKSPAIEYGKKVDEIAKEFQALIKATEDKLLIQRRRVEDNEARKQREIEEAEENRTNAIKQRINAYNQYPMQCLNKSADVIEEMIILSMVPTVEEFEEFYDEAMKAYQEADTQMKLMRDGQILVENAKAIQAEKEAEAKRIQDEEDAKLQAEKDLLAEQRAVFQKQKDDFERMQKEQQEVLDRKEAERLADELQAQQEAEKKELEANRSKNYDEAVAVLDTLIHIKDLTAEEIINEIIANKVPHVKWGGVR